jgi:hypothetical protein
VSNRYEIFDILTQDADGVAFLATDHESGDEVVLRRFFPFGVDGRGLEEEECAAYEIAVQRLREVRHPALLSVLDGGIDPIDRMPYFVTEWLGGATLARKLETNMLSPDSAKWVLELALETSQMLSEVFQEERLWIETSPQNIFLNEQETDRFVTFRIAPLRWLGEDEDRPGLQSLLKLAEAMLDWQRRRKISDHDAEGLGAWVRQLRRDPCRWNLDEARKALHTAPRPRSATRPPDKPAEQATTPTAPRRTDWRPWIAATCLTLIAIAFVYWQASRIRRPLPPPEIPPTPTVENRKAAAEKPATIPDQRPTLASQLGEKASARGPLRWVRSSSTGKTLYLRIDDPAWAGEVHARYQVRHELITEEALRRMVDRPIQARGMVVSDLGGLVTIDLTEPGDLRELDE